MEKEQIIPQDISLRITAIRYFGIVAVVICHVFQIFYYNSNGEIPVLKHPDFAITFPFKVVGSTLFFGACFGAVPMFFLFSGFLQFSKLPPYSKIVKKRVYSLLMPMLLWFILAIIEMLALLHFMGWHTSFSFLKSSNPVLWIEAFLGDFSKPWVAGTHCPQIMYQFWFIRDLFILALLTPLIRYLTIKNSRAIPFLTLSFILLITGFRPIIMGGDSLFYYSLGAFCAFRKIDFFKILDKYWHWGIAILSATFFVWWMNYVENINFDARIVSLVQLSAALMLLKISGIIKNTPKLFSIAKVLNSYDFFLYSAHTNYLMVFLLYISTFLFPVKTTFGMFLASAWILFANLAICTGVGALLKHYFPSLFSFLCGGRQRAKPLTK